MALKGCQQAEQITESIKGCHKSLAFYWVRREDAKAGEEHDLFHILIESFWPHCREQKTGGRAEERPVRQPLQRSR